MDPAGKIKQIKKPRNGAPVAKIAKDADTLALEKTLTDTLGLNVDIEHAGDKGGYVKISYKTLEQLDAICVRLNRVSR